MQLQVHNTCHCCRDISSHLNVMSAREMRCCVSRNIYAVDACFICAVRGDMSELHLYISKDLLYIIMFFVFACGLFLHFHVATG